MAVKKPKVKVEVEEEDVDELDELEDLEDLADESDEDDVEEEDAEEEEAPRRKKKAKAKVKKESDTIGSAELAEALGTDGKNLRVMLRAKGVGKNANNRYEWDSVDDALEEMGFDDLDRFLSDDEIVPSSGFAARVMDAVRVEAAAPPAIPFPWLRALPGIAATVVSFATIIAGFFSVGRTALDAPANPGDGDRVAAGV